MSAVREKAINVNGVRISYTVIGESNAKPVFFVHGLLSNGRDYDALGQALAELGYRCICIDLPGRGKSDWLPDQKQYAPHNYTHYCRALIEKEIGAAPFDWFGVSLGGLLGMGVCSLPNTNVKRLIVVDIGAQIPRKGLNGVSLIAKKNAAFNSRGDAISHLKARCAAWGIEHQETWEHLIAHNIIKDGNQYRMHYDPAIGKALPKYNITIRLWRVWKKIKQPVLILRGENSALLPEKITRKMQRKYKGESYNEVIFDKCGHVPNLMENAHISKVLNWF